MWSDVRSVRFVAKWVLLLDTQELQDSVVGLHSREDKQVAIFCNDRDSCQQSSLCNLTSTRCVFQICFECKPKQAYEFFINSWLTYWNTTNLKQFFMHFLAGIWVSGGCSGAGQTDLKKAANGTFPKHLKNVTGRLKPDTVGVTVPDYLAKCSA